MMNPNRRERQVSQFRIRMQELKEASDAQESVVEHHRINRMRSVASFLQSFGYLEHEVVAFDRVSRNRVSSALVKFQKFYGLDPTGIVDDFTLAAIQIPRCAQKDVGDRQGCFWERRELTYRFANQTRDIDPASDALQAVRNAFDSWQSLGKVKFEERDSGSVDIEVSWVPSLEDELRAVGDVVAAADYPGECARTRRSPKPILFDDDNRWIIGQASNKVDVESVALHEIGHILGLGHAPFPFGDDAMHPTFIPGMAPKRTLQQWDLAEFSSLYP